MIINWQLIADSLPNLLRGMTVSIQIALLSGFIGFTLGTLLGLAQEYAHSLIRLFVTFYVIIIRGTPMLIQIFIAYYVLPELGISLPAFWTATIAIGLNSSAYICSIVRSGIASVNKGQIEAAQVLGFSTSQTIQLIVLPQAIRIMLPAFGNELVTLIKDSSLASIIGVVELSKESSAIRNKYFDSISIFFIVAILYFIMTTTVSLCMYYLEQRMNKHVKY